MIFLTNRIYQSIKKTILLFTLIVFTLTSCNALKPKWVDSRKVPVNAEERAKYNVKTGKGLSAQKVLGGSRGGRAYEFSTSNPMWRASLEILDFLPLATVDYSGGIIITDWYNDSSSNDAIKITVRFLSNEIRADSLKITVHQKNCNQAQNCSVKPVKSKIQEELLASILRNASVIEKNKK